MSEKVLLVGNNVRNVAESAKKAGFRVSAVTKFIDADLKLYCDGVFELPEKGVEKFVERIAEKESARVVLCSGFETLDIKCDLLCSNPDECRKVVDKLSFYRTLEKVGIPHPRLLSRSEAEEEGRFVVKPRIGGGGEDVRLGELFEGDIVIQEYVEGVPCSVSLIAYGSEARVVASNLILAGWDEMNASGFRYAGNVTPLRETLDGVKIDADAIRKMERTAIEVVSLFELRGSVGVDFILSRDGPYVLEINPRFQGSLDSVEWSCDVNLFRLHMTAFDGKKDFDVRCRRYGMRAILFSSGDITIRREITGNPFYADIPVEGSRYLPGDPLTSILASGFSVEEVKKKVLSRKRLFHRLVF